MNGVSVIICCYNSEKLIEKCLLHLFRQQLRPDILWEIIVVNNCSTDSTVDIARKTEKLYNISGIPFRIVDELTPGHLMARIKGRNIAAYDYLIYVDDDNMLADDYVGNAFELMNSDEYIAVIGGFGNEVFESDYNPPDWFASHKISYAVGYQNESLGNTADLHEVYGAGFVIRKNIWLLLENNGFINLLGGRKGAALTSGDDTELCYAARLAGYKVVFVPSLIFNHFISSYRLSENYLERLYFGFGKANVVIGVYKYYLENDVNLRTKRVLPLWLDRYLYLLKILYKFKKENKIITKYSREWSKLIEIKGQMHELVNLRGKYDRFYDTVLQLKMNLKK